MKRCMYCGHENDDASRTCVKCGNQLLDMPAANTAPADDGIDAPLQPDDAAAQAAADQIQINDEGPGYLRDAGMQSGQMYGQPYGAGDYGQQYGPGDYGQPYGGGNYGQPYAGPGYGYSAQAEGQAQYGGQAYGYEGEPMQYGPADPYFQDETPQGDPAYIMEKARRRVKSPLFFLIAFIFMIATVAEIVYIVTGGSIDNLSTFTNTLTKQYLGKQLVTDYMQKGVEWVNAQNVWYVKGILLGTLFPALLMIFGYWMAFGATTNKRAEISTAGYTLVKIAEILKFIGVCLLLLAGIVGTVVLVVAFASAKSMFYLILGVIALLVMIILTVFTIMYYIQVLFGMKVVKVNAKTGKYIGKIPGFAIFIGFVGAAVSGASMIFMAAETYVDYIGLIARGATAAYLLLISLWALVYRATVKLK